MQARTSAMLLGLCACASPTPIWPMPQAPVQAPPQAPAQAPVPRAPAGPPGPQKQTPEQYASSFHGGIAALLGWRTYNSDLGSVGANQFVTGVELVLRYGTFPIGLEIGFTAGVGLETSNAGIFVADLTSSSAEFYLGPRFTWDLFERKLRPYVGGGATWLSVTTEQLDPVGFVFVDDDSTFAGYVHTGFTVDLDGASFLGIDARWDLGTDMTLFGSQVDLDYWQLSLLIGGRF